MPYIVSQKRRHSDLRSYPDQLTLSAGAAGIEAGSISDCSVLSIEDLYQLGEPVVADCIEAELACCVAIIDIDRLFRVSETHGSDCADHVLSEFGESLLRLTADLYACVAHLGQDQFGLLLVGMDVAMVTGRLDRLRQDLASRPIGWKGEMINITVSIGIAEIHGPETFDNYLNAAEQFLFIAKMSGRNQVISDHTFAAAIH
jgi:diguanylate cyclase (GGDEF)-like protein